MDEQKYISAILAGEGSAYRHLVERYQTGLIIYCEQLVHNRHEAEDIAQDTFLKAYEKIGEFNAEKARFSTWLYRIASHKAIDSLRRNKHQVDVEHVEDLADIATVPTLHNDEREAIHQAIDSLEPPVFAQIIKAYFWQGKSYQKIADEFNIPISTVGTWLSRAKIQLKEKLS